MPLPPIFRPAIIYPPHARYRVIAPYGIVVDGYPYAENDELEMSSPLRQMPRRIQQLCEQRKLQLIIEES